MRASNIISSTIWVENGTEVAGVVLRRKPRNKQTVSKTKMLPK